MKQQPAPSHFNRRIIGAGIALGVAAFVAIGLIMFVGARNGEVQPEPGPPVTVGQVPMAGAAHQLSEDFARVAAAVRPAVVSVYSERMVKVTQPDMQMPFDEEFFRRFFGEGFPQMPGPQMPQGPQMPREFQQRGMGSGMIIDKEGRVLTNYHVVKDMDELEVRLADKRAFKAEVIGADPPTDVAVLRIKGEVPKDLPIVKLGNSDTLEVGHLVMAVGAPFGFVQTVTTGVLSAKDRSGIGINDYENFLQTDAAINPGNSGGPLVNMSGEVIGVNSAIATQMGQFAGVGFAIPINMVKEMLPTLLEGKQITRGMLGVVIQDLTAELSQSFGIKDSRGALVAQVQKDSPAAAAGIEVGDVIVRFGDRPVDDTTHLRNMVAGTRPGTNVELVTIRNGEERKVSVTIGTLEVEKPEIAAPGGAEADATRGAGLTVQTLTPELARELKYEGEKGALVSAVQSGSPAARAGLRRGDLVVEADRKPVTSAEELRTAIAAAKDSILLRVRRGEASQFVVLPLK